MNATPMIDSYMLLTRGLPEIVTRHQKPVAAQPRQPAKQSRPATYSQRPSPMVPRVKLASRHSPAARANIQALRKGLILLNHISRVIRAGRGERPARKF